jgi:hypothetical protein
MIINGAAYACGNIAPYITGYYRDLGNNTNLYEFYSLFPIIIASSTIFMPIGMKVAQSHHPFV